MQFDIQANGFSMTESIRDYTELRMTYALKSNDKQVIGVKVRLSDINGPRGGVDKCCQVGISLVGQNDIVIEDIESDLYVAIDRASDRCARTLSRRLERSREFTHEKVVLPVTEASS